MQVAAEILDEFEGGVFFVTLANIADPELVAPTIAGALGDVGPAEDEIGRGLEEHLRNREMLLVLDNFEQVVGAAPLVGELLASCPGLKVLATSRGLLRVYGEREYPVPAMRLPDPGGCRREGLADYEAVGLFLERARSVRQISGSPSETRLRWPGSASASRPSPGDRAGRGPQRLLPPEEILGAWRATG